MSVVGWEQGDVVALNSGGPEMTVDWVQETESGKVYIHTKWFDVHNTIQDGRFKEEMIKFIS